VNLFCEVHSGLPREGPGSIETTRKAFMTLRSLPMDFKLLEIGCGPGLQTLELARMSENKSGHIVATDINETFLGGLRASLSKSAIYNVTVQQEDMFSLSFEEGVFDVIWSEGSIFILGFERGLNEWKKHLTPNGVLLVSELSWLENGPPEEARSFWSKSYPKMLTLEENVAVAKNCGYEVESSFTLPESDWFDEYYLPMESRIKSLKLKYRGIYKKQMVLNGFIQEIDMYRKYSKSYGYVFFTFRKKG